MPKKTKKQKILARARRIIISQNNTGPDTSPTTQSNTASVKPTNLYQFQTPKTTKTEEEYQNTQELNPIRRDIIKTIIFATIAIIVEIIISRTT